MADTFAADLASEGFAHRYVRIDGQKIHCSIRGEGRPILLIPGWPQTWYAWRHVMVALAENGFQSIAVDPVGTGHSARPESGYDTGTAARLLHQVMIELGHSRYGVAGHDVGMWVGYALASDYPDAVERIALTEAVIPGLAPAPQIFVPPSDNIFLWHFMFNQVLDLPEFLTSGREKEYLSFMFDKWSHRRDRVAADVYAAAYGTPGGIRAGFAYYRAIPETIRQNLERANRPLAMPVLAIGSEYATADAPMETLRPHATDLRGEIVRDCGHFIMEECPHEFNAQLVPFFLEGMSR
ncbi:alpha/beta hydrolase [Bradyrhizobium sp. NAS80.1]|uniref:alpha/beta fold hydrolase n=1 Tax=Bradyrhizobium sp. NAS80.1 TaxID=1680159 RepID=UPI00096751F1|nr:alpha/beta hydrolase [Bradyrhizobium sp. NAS80.1]OKO72661.1 alpha/beta hydrolase [Bradyrhizobium sp. NAS80.1]